MSYFLFVVVSTPKKDESTKEHWLQVCILKNGFKKRFIKFEKYMNCMKSNPNTKDGECYDNSVMKTLLRT